MPSPHQTLYRRYAQRVEQATALDPPPLRGGRRRNGGAPEPAAAYGPPGGSGARGGAGPSACHVAGLLPAQLDLKDSMLGSFQRRTQGPGGHSRAECSSRMLPLPVPGPAGEENISVVVAPIREGFTLQKMGAPQEAAQTFLQTTGAAGRALRQGCCSLCRGGRGGSSNSVLSGNLAAHGGTLLAACTTHQRSASLRVPNTPIHRSRPRGLWQDSDAAERGGAARRQGGALLFCRI